LGRIYAFTHIRIYIGWATSTLLQFNASTFFAGPHTLIYSINYILTLKILKNQDIRMENERSYHRVRQLCLQHHLSLAVLFGSYTGQKTDQNSDVDIAVMPEQPDTEVDLLQLIVDIESMYNKTVDLVLLSSKTDSLILFEIFRNGRLLYEKEAGLFDAQFVRACKLYYDTAPLRIMESQYLQSLTKTG
jgi:predicted nucleotidyltransferase